jgi:hypothetical protein
MGKDKTPLATLPQAPFYIRKILKKKIDFSAMIFRDFFSWFFLFF